VAAVDDVRGGEAHFIEEVDATEETELIVAPVVKPPSARRQSHGLHRLISSFVDACAVVARDRGFQGSGQFRPA
jgi:hypothetical protein